MKNTTPAVLIYYQDFIVGMSNLNMAERGQYFTLCMYQNAHGHMDKEYMEDVLGEEISKRVLRKFSVDEDGLYYNERMEMEIARRCEYSNSRSRNRKKTCESHKKDMKNTCQSYEKHMETETETETEIITKNKKETKTSNKKEIFEIVEYLNQKIGTHYKPTTQATIKLINARLAEDFTVEDFKTVIDKKVADWAGTKWAAFLKPGTLFSGKFEGYLNQVRPSRDMTMDELARVRGGTTHEFGADKRITQRSFGGLPEHISDDG